MCITANKHGPPRKMVAHRHKRAGGKREGAAGNILVKAHEGSNPLTMAYDAANRLTTTILGATQLTTYTYSNAGEMTGERCDYLGIRATFVYDGEHRCLNELRASGANHTYTYGSDGLRRSAHMAGTANAISFVWDGTDLLNEYVSGALSGRYLALDGEVLSEKRGASRYVYGVDPLGSVVHLLDSGLNRAGTYVYWPYGEVQSHTGVDTPMQYVGGLGYYTSTTNRVYVRARWLRPDLGRWMTEDPIGFEGGDWNVVAYLGSSPVSRADPTGLLSLWLPCPTAAKSICKAAGEQGWRYTGCRMHIYTLPKYPCIPITDINCYYIGRGPGGGRSRRRVRPLPFDDKVHAYTDCLTTCADGLVNSSLPPSMAYTVFVLCIAGCQLIMAI